MGSKPSKSTTTANVLNLFTPNEQIKLKNIFAKINDDKAFNLQHLQAYLGNTMSSQLSAGFFNLMSCNQIESEPAVVEYFGFVSAISRILKSSPNDLAVVFLRLTDSGDGSEIVSCKDIFDFAELVVNTCLNLLVSGKEFNIWNELLTNTSGSLLSRLLIKELVHPDSKNNDTDADLLSQASYTESDVAIWLTKTPLLLLIWNYMCCYYFPISLPPSLLPRCTNKKPITKTMLDVSFILMLNQYLPSEAKSEWCQLFNTATDGESFTVMIGQILEKGRTLVVIKDKDGHVFGGFASQSWQMNASFRGTPECFVFSLLPNLNVYQSTGYNDHFMYLNQNQQTLPNGIGFGGQFEYFGIWLDADFGTGRCSQTCVTFNSPQLSASPEFKIEAVEVWRVGPEPTVELERESGSILDKDPAAEAMLEMIGRAPVSKGLREEPSST